MLWSGVGPRGYISVTSISIDGHGGPGSDEVTKTVREALECAPMTTSAELTDSNCSNDASPP